MVKQRDSFFDNAKYLAIVLVAIGHTWAQMMDDSRAVESAYRVVYTFHMPAFVVISGYFSRSFDLRPDRLRRLVTGVLVPYVVFETGYELFKDVADRPDPEISLLDPSYLMWFLAALFIWRLTTPLWKVLRSPLPAAVAVAMLASVSPSIGTDFDLQRVLQFLPYFVLGLCLRPEHFLAVRRRSVRIAAVPVGAAAFAVAWWSVPRMNGGWFYRQSAAQDLGAPWWCGPVMTLASIGCALALTACFFAWVPGRRLWCTALGAGTITGYLLHGFLVKFAEYRGWFGAPWVHSPLGAVAVTVLAAAAVTLLCTPPVRRALRCVTEPRMAWAFRPDPAAEARAREQAPAAREPVPARVNA
ncbi:acyltransferase family protein [Streptomyces sp. NPDC014006]|uniref:acyltransferase family protein n=1 Tax=Streptomyces sp. NPDC014006 TaxID=3364870 RepID=UPI0037002462